MDISVPRSSRPVRCRFRARKCLRLNKVTAHTRQQRGGFPRGSDEKYRALRCIYQESISDVCELFISKIILNKILLNRIFPMIKPRTRATDGRADDQQQTASTTQYGLAGGNPADRDRPMTRRAKGN